MVSYILFIHSIHSLHSYGVLCVALFMSPFSHSLIVHESFSHIFCFSPFFKVFSVIPFFKVFSIIHTFFTFILFPVVASDMMSFTFFDTLSYWYIIIYHFFSIHSLNHTLLPFILSFFRSVSYIHLVKAYQSNEIKK